MQKLIRFWQKDLINKLIVLSFVGIFAGVGTLSVLVISMPDGKSIQGAIGEYFPTPTLEPRAVLTLAAESALTQSAAATASVPPTITTMPFTPFQTLPTPTATFTALPAVDVLPPTATATMILPSSTPTAAPVLPTATSTPTAVLTTPTLAPSSGPADLSCVPTTTLTQTGKVLDVLDGNTAKVMIDGFVYVVRYIGIEIPRNPNYALLAATTNGQLVFGKEITLISDAADKDSSGRLLRYVKVGDKYPAAELLKLGLASALDTPPNSSCARAFQTIEQAARDAKLGLWLPTPTLPALP
jgi:micrococcal nuclease